MSTVTQELLDVAKTASLDQAKLVLATSKKGFVDAFREWIDAKDLVLLDELYEGALRAKARQFLAGSTDAAAIAADEYEASLNSIDALFLRYEIVGKAKLGALARSMAHQIISGVFAVGGAVLQAGLGVVLPGLGSLIGAGLNAGLQHVVAYFLED